ncbi:MAG: hypothetical protein N2V75_05350 [Methanophagales archaeon]|nr:hypothetical protein [Methanophagales archaeon]
MSETKTKKVKDLKAGNTVDTTFLTMEKEVTSLFEPGDIVRIKGVAERSTEKNDIAEFSRTLKNIDFLFAEEAVPQLLLTPKISLLFGFKALYAFLFLPILDCWTASEIVKTVTEEGGLVDHIVLGYRMVEDRIKGIKGFPEELSLRLLHLILSHHNYGEWGSPVKPLFAEALCYADLFDSQLKEFLQIQKHEEAKGREGVWSDYSRRLDRFFYLGRKEKK